VSEPYEIEIIIICPECHCKSCDFIVYDEDCPDIIFEKCENCKGISGDIDYNDFFEDIKENLLKE
jgi:Zn finger protein HypA/HybF involved in hydrogenase expression